MSVLQDFSAVGTASLNDRFGRKNLIPFFEKCYHSASEIFGGCWLCLAVIGMPDALSPVGQLNSFNNHSAR